MSHLLSGLILLPLAGALAILFVPGEGDAAHKNVRWIALATTIITFAMSLVAWHRFDATSPAFQLVEEGAWVSEAIRFKLGRSEIMDGIS